MEQRAAQSSVLFIILLGIIVLLGSKKVEPAADLKQRNAR
jgi:hypothetical protein